MPLRLRSAGGGSVLLKPPVALAADVSMEVPGYEGAKILTDKTPGVVLQVVQATCNTAVSSTSGTWIATGLSGVITPKSATSKVLVTFSIFVAGSINATQPNVTLRRNGADIVPTSYGLGNTYATAAGYNENVLSSSWLDFPASISAQTYSVWGRNPSSQGYAAFNDSARTSVITLMEIAA